MAAATAQHLATTQKGGVQELRAGAKSLPAALQPSVRQGMQQRSRVAASLLRNLQGAKDVGRASGEGQGEGGAVRMHVSCVA